jgi:multidrug transporter EmrE-like cation transporter
MYLPCCFIFLCREKMDSVFGNVALVAASEIFANFHLRWFATGGGTPDLLQGVLGYGAVVYFLTQALRLENVLYVNALWDGLSAIFQSAAAVVFLGDRLKTGQEYVGMLFVFAGVFLMHMGKKT